MSTLDHIVLNGRSGGGKSELIDFLKGLSDAERRERYHLGALVELDDFPWLWDKFVEDDLWEELGEARRYSRRHEHGYVQLEGDRLLDMLVLKFNRVVAREYGRRPEWYGDHTLFIEFARGVPDGGYARAYELLSDAIWARAGIVYIDVSYEESRRRNEARYQEKLAHSILAHRLPDESQERFSAEQDFLSLAGGRDSGWLEIRDQRVPFVVIHNEPELKDPVALAERYGPAMQRLAELAAQR